MHIGKIYLAAILALSLTQAAMAVPADIQVASGNEWKHVPTGLKLPAQLAGSLERQKVTAIAGPETDVGANYWSADGADNVTIYLYRNVSGSVPVWFDRARNLIQLLPEKYPNPKSLGIRPFTPRGQQVASGLFELFTTDSKFRATGVMLLPVNGFYAKIRASSSTRGPGELEQLMQAAVNGIDWSSRAKEVAAVPVADCPTPLPARSPAKLAKLNQQDQMMAALLGGVVAQAATIEDDKEVSKEAVQVSYCREPGPLQIPYGIYRPAGSADRYMMAIFDAGRAIVVGSSDILQILAEMKKPARVSVSYVEMERTSTFGDFKTLPLPEQALEHVQKSAPISIASTWGDKREVSINSGN